MLDTPLRGPDQDHGALLPTDLSSPTSRLFDASARMEDKAALLAAAQEWTQAEDAIHGRRPRELLNNRQFRLDQQLARERVSFDKIQGEISGLSEAVSLLATSVGQPENSVSSARPELDTVSGLAATMEQPTTSLGINGQSPAHKNCLFSTQPATANNLPPVAEINTLASGIAAMARNTQHPQGQPLHFRNLQVPMSRPHASSMFDELPQSYGFHKLKRQSISLADGTERSYFTLPAEYPLEQASAPMSLSAREKVGVTAPPSVAARQSPVICYKADNTAGSESLLVNDVKPQKTMQDASSVFNEMPVYDIYEEDNSFLNCMDEQLATPFHNASENASSEQLLTCFGKAPETEQPSVCLDIVTDMLVVTLELQQLDDERTCNCLVLKSSESFVTGSRQLSIEQNMRELRLLWDPGASSFLHSSKGSAVSILQQLHNKNISSMQEFSLEKGSHVLGDPGIKLILYELWWLSKMNEYAALRHLLAVKFDTRSYTYLIDTAAIMCDPPANLIQQRRPIEALLHVWPYKLLSSLVYTWDPGIALSSYRYSWLESGTAWHKAVPAWVWSSSPFFADLQYHLPMIKAYSFWDPGIVNQLDMMLDKSVVPNLFHSTRTIFVGQPIDLKQFRAQLLLLQSHSWYNTLNAFLQVHYCCLPFDTHCAYSERVQQLVCHSRMFSSTNAVLSAMCMSTAIIVCKMLVLISGEIAQEGRDATVVYHDLKIQLPMIRTSHIPDPRVKGYCWLDIWTEQSDLVNPLSCINIPELPTWQSQVINASYVWDPGTILPWYRSILLLLLTEEKGTGRQILKQWSWWCNAYCKIFQRCTAMSSLFQCHGIPLWLINFKVP